MTTILTLSLCLYVGWAHITLLPWLGILATLLAVLPVPKIQEHAKEALTATLTLILIQKIQTFHYGLSPFIPDLNLKTVHILMIAWGLQALKNKPKFDTLFQNPGTWLLSLFTLLTILLEHIHLQPWQWNPTQRNLEAMILGFMLALTPTKKPSVLWTLSGFCLIVLLTPKIHLLTSIPLPEVPIIPKNPGCTLSALCIALLLISRRREAIPISLTLTLLILTYQSIGALTISLLCWAIYFIPKIYQKIAKHHKILFTLLILISAAILSSTTHSLLTLTNKDTSASGRIPLTKHLIKNWIPQSPALGFGEGFRQTIRPPDGPGNHKNTVAGPINEALHLYSLNALNTANNAFFEGTTQYGIPTMMVLLYAIILLNLYSPYPNSHKILLGTCLLLILNYTSMRPFSWQELGVLWLLPHLLARPPENQKLQSTPPIPTPKLILSFIGITASLLIALHLSIQKSHQNPWEELWIPTQTLELIPFTPSAKLTNRGVITNAERLQTAAQEERIPSKLLRPYLSGILLIQSPNPKTAQQDKNMLEKKTGIAIQQSLGHYKPSHTIQTVLLFLTPLLLTLAVSVSLQQNNLTKVSLLSLLSVFALTLPNKPLPWAITEIQAHIQPPKPPNLNPWASIWNAKMQATAHGELLCFHLHLLNQPSEFRYSKSQSSKRLKIQEKEKVIPIKIFTTASTKEIQWAEKETQSLLTAIDKKQRTKEKVIPQ